MSFRSTRFFELMNCIPSGIIGSFARDCRPQFTRSSGASFLGGPFDLSLAVIPTPPPPRWPPAAREV